VIRRKSITSTVHHTVATAKLAPSYHLLLRCRHSRIRTSLWSALFSHNVAAERLSYASHSISIKSNTLCQFLFYNFKRLIICTDAMRSQISPTRNSPRIMKGGPSGGSVQGIQLADHPPQFVEKKSLQLLGLGRRCYTQGHLNDG
jgi:hypothetical protein